jgi:dolichol-phosphate mannosyltransferase
MSGTTPATGISGPPSSAKSAQAPTFCVVIPMYNEEEGAARCVKKVAEELTRLAGGHKLIVVNDASGDRTGAILSELSDSVPDLEVLTHPANRGYGGALRTGAARAAERGFDYVVYMDSDLTNDPSELGRFLEKMREGYGVIKASRYCEGSKVVDVPQWRRVISLVGNAIAGGLYGLTVRDCTNGFRAVRTDLIRQMRLHENGFAMILEELYQAKHCGGTFCEIPYVLAARSTTGKQSSFSYRPRVFYSYLKYPLLSALGRKPW